MTKTLGILSLLSLSVLAQATGTGRSYTPIFGYDDKNGALYGAAVFLYADGRPGYKLGLYGASNARDFHSLTLNWDQQGEGGLDLSLHSSVDRGFDDYYGEGDATPSRPGLRIRQDRAELRASALLGLGQGWSAGPVAGLRARRETGLQDAEGAAVDGRAFGDSANPALGLRLEHDDRDSRLSSTRGGLFSLELRALPSSLALGSASADAWQAEGELRRFTALGRGVVLASRAGAGASLGDPGYLERYSLGGTAELRGFQDNRFRGRQYWCVQEELRLPLYRMVSAAVSADLGDAGDGRLDAPRKSAQAGLRVGLPPDYGMQARLDSGWGDGGERSLMLQFGHTF